ncbi:DNA topoisomerase 2-associated protein pat1 [Batrachochytrium dendrobatidis]
MSFFGFDTALPSEADSSEPVRATHGRRTNNHRQHSTSPANASQTGKGLQKKQSRSRQQSGPLVDKGSQSSTNKDSSRQDQHQLLGLQSGVAVSDNMDGDHLDEMLRDRYENSLDTFGDNDQLMENYTRALDEENQDLNDETFGDAAIDPSGRDFQYANHNVPHELDRQGPARPSAEGSPISKSQQLQQKNELMAAQQQRRLMQQQAAENMRNQSAFNTMPGAPSNHPQVAPQYMRQMPPSYNGGGLSGISSNKPMSSFQEIEAQMMRQARMGASNTIKMDQSHLLSSDHMFSSRRVVDHLHPHNAGTPPTQGGGVFSQRSPQGMQSMINMSEVEAAMRSRQAQFGMQLPSPMHQSMMSNNNSPPMNASDIETMLRAQQMGQNSQIQLNQQLHSSQFQQMHPMIQQHGQPLMRSEMIPGRYDYASSPPVQNSPNTMFIEEQLRRQQLGEMQREHPMQPSQGGLSDNQTNRLASNLPQHQPSVVPEQQFTSHDLDYAEDLENEIGFEDPDCLEEIQTKSKLHKQKLEDERDQPIFAVDTDEDFPALGATRTTNSNNFKNNSRSKQPFNNTMQKKYKNQRERHQGDQRIPIDFVYRERERFTPNDSHLSREARYKGLMRKFEMEYIAKIQVSNLFSEDPHKDDYYYHVFTQRKKEKEAAELADGSTEKSGFADPSLNWQQSLFVKTGRKGGRGANAMLQVQHQMKRIIESRKHQRIKEQTLSLEGTLGKITSTTSRNPKKAIQVATSSPSEGHQSSVSSGNALSAGVVLKSIEKVYSTVLDLEYLQQSKNHEAESDEEKPSKYLHTQNKLWTSLRVMESTPNTMQHPFVCMLNYSKGARILPRALRFFDRNQLMQIFAVILNRFECLKVSNIFTGIQNSDVDAFMGNVIPLLVGVISEAPMIAVISLARTVLERHNIIWFAKNKVGISILTMLLSRAEVLKQGLPNIRAPSEQELGMWSEIYNFLFQSLQGHFSSLFPTNPLSADNVCVWQFMSAVAVGASGIDHQRILVTEVREHVMHASKTGDPKALDNVNLFLNALGLGISAAQLAAMPI